MKKINLENSIAYIQGNIRYKLYYNHWLSWLIPDYIHKQIDIRINSMNRKCYSTGSCILCGCQTTHLQMANKSCEGNCYPKMLSRKQWKVMIVTNILLIENTLWKIKNVLGIKMFVIWNGKKQK
jgi:hypothetical protein